MGSDIAKQAASDFFSVEVWTPRGLMTHYVLFVISIADRIVHVAGITTRPDEAWMLQVGRNLVDEQEGALAGKKYLIIDRDTKYSQRFRAFLEEGGTKVIRLPPSSDTARRNPQLLPPCRCVKPAVEFVDTTRSWWTFESGLGGAGLYPGAG